MMNNPNKLTGETVIEKLKHYLVDVENAIYLLISNHHPVPTDYYILRDDYKWCIEKLSATEGE